MRRSIAGFGILAFLVIASLVSCGDSLWGDLDNPRDPENFELDTVMSGLSGPIGLALDSAGRIYVVEHGEHDVWRRDQAAETEEVFAGSPESPGYNGDGIPAIDAQLYNPRGAAFDSNGNLYIADTNNNIVRMVDTGGFIWTVAGIPNDSNLADDGVAADSTTIRNPYDVAIGLNGDLFISDAGSSVVYRVDGGTGFIYRYAGIPDSWAYAGDNGPAISAGISLSDPGMTSGSSGIDVDKYGNLYIADTGNHVVRKVDIGTGIITTVVGNGVQGWSDGSLNTPRDVLVTDDGTIYVVDGYTYTSSWYDEWGVEHPYDIPKGRVSMVSGGQMVSILESPAWDDYEHELNYFNPTALAQGPDGAIYVADSEQGKVYRLSF